jgi:ubiquinone/menaquinone biosynthesis C-methylase UbiE
MTKIARALLDYDNPNSYVNSLRRQRMQHFRNLLEKLYHGQQLAILDVGGTYQYWFNSGLLDKNKYHLTLLNLSASLLPPGSSGFSAVAGNAMGLDYGDDSFDVVFSNSVIEHMGSRHGQRLMAAEVMRVGKAYYVQTPSYWFPLEPHSRIPFFQFVPRSIRALMIWKLRINYFPTKPTYRECLLQSDSTIMLTKREFQSLFPSAEIYVERLYGIDKSYTAYAGFPD